MTESRGKKTGNQAPIRKNQGAGHGNPASRKVKGCSPSASVIFRSIFEESPIGIELYDRSGVLIDANRACLEIFGVRDVEAVRGFKLFEDPNVDEELKKRLRKGEGVRYEAAFDFDRVRSLGLYETSKSGVAFLDVLITPLHSESGASGFMVQVQDVTLRRLAEEELKKNRDELEARVAERTGELVSINSKLERELHERALAEEALRDSEARWRSLVECAPDIILTLDEKGVIQYINFPPEGLSPEQAVGTDVCNYVPEEFRGTVRKAINTVFLTGEPSSYEIAARGPHDALSWYTSHIGPIKKDGRVLSAVLITRDITKRKRVEEERRRSESQLRTLIQSIPDMVFFKDAQGRHLLVNRACEEFLGMGQEEVIGKTVAEFMPADIAEACRRSDEEAMRTPWPVVVEEVAGEEPFKVHLETVKSSIRDESGNITGLVVVSRDITERKRAEETLRLFSVALDEAPDGIQVVDTEGRILYSNKAIERMFGYTHEELKGKRVSILNVDDEFAGTHIFPSIRESGQWAGELMVRRKDGGEFPIWLTASMVKNGKGEPLAMIGVSRDVTQRKRMEEELRVKDKAIGAAVSGIGFCDTQGMMTYANDSFLRMWGYENAEEVLGRPAFEVVTEPEEALRIFEELREVGSWTGELSARRKDGSDFHVHVSASLVTNEAGEPICMMGSFVNITEQKLLEERLREASITDDLTGLLNRRGFMALAEQQFKLTEREQGLLFLLFADFDNLKTINDTFGHHTGDRALRETADLLRKTFRESDIIGRVGGDEFALLLTGESGMGDEAAITTRFEENIRDFNRQEGREYRLAISAGIVRFDAGCMRTFGEFLSRADNLMYENKKKKRRKSVDVRPVP